MPKTQDSQTETQEPATETSINDKIELSISQKFHPWFGMAEPNVCQSTAGTGIDIFAPANNAASDYRLALGLNPAKLMAAAGVDNFIVSSLSIRGTQNGNQIRFTCDDRAMINQGDRIHRGKWWTVGLLTLQSEEDAKKAAAALMKGEFAAIVFDNLRHLEGAEECKEQYTALSQATARIGGDNLFGRKGVLLYDLKKMVLMWEPSGAPLSETTCWHNENIKRRREALAGTPQGITASELSGPVGQV